MSPIQSQQPVKPSPVPPAFVQRTGSVGFLIASLCLLVTYSRVAELIMFVTGARIPMSKILAAVAILGILCSVRNLVLALSSRIGFLLMAYSGWLCFIIPFSNWKGGSFGVLTDDWLPGLFVFFPISALIFTMEQFRKTLYMFVLSAILIALFSLRLGGMDFEGRFAFSGGTLANANDLAIHLLLVLPICAAVIAGRFSMTAKVTVFPVAGWILYAALRTGSRTGLLTLAAIVLVGFMMVGVRQRAMAVVLTLMLGIPAIVLIPSNLRARYFTLFSDEAKIEDLETVSSAQDSARLRTRLLWHSWRIAFENPIVGVGMGNFTVVSTKESENRQDKVFWKQAHNIYGQIAAETGLVGLALYVSIVVACIRTCWRIRAQTKGQPALADIRLYASVLIVCNIAYATSSIFGTSTYSFYIPVLAAVTCAFERCTKLELAVRDIKKPASAARPAAGLQFPTAMPWTPAPVPVASTPLPPTGRGFANQRPQGSRRNS